MEATGAPLDERRERLDARILILVDAVGDAMVATTMDGRIVGGNASACRMFGYAREELTSLVRSDLVKDAEALAVAISERRRDGSARGVLSFRRKNGEAFEGEFTSVEVLNAEGQERVWIVVHDLEDRRRAERATSELYESNEMLRALTDAAFEAVVIHRDGVILVANRAAEEAARVAPGGLVGKRLFDFIAPEALPMVLEKIKNNDEAPYDSFGRRSDGSIYPLEVQVRVSGQPARVAAVRDVTERKKLEDELRHAQKMEAVGTLAGGIAHDFNNLLSVVIGGVELAALHLDAGSAALGPLADVRAAAGKAADLTRQLLAFGRKQVVAPRALDLNRTLRGMESMLRSLLGSQIGLSFTFGSPLGAIVADPSQLELMLLNLAANARDAMPSGGSLRLETARAVVAAPEAERLGIAAGPVVSLRVTDDGIGMDAATRGRIFEPFFTTKEEGRGTGLGLSTVFGIVKQNRGSIAVDSEPGRGTTFTVLLPETAEAPAVSVPPTTTVATPGKRTVLVVDDEPVVRKIVVAVLRRAGFEVLDADSPQAAFDVLARRTATVDLLVTDMLLGGESGRALAVEIQKRSPGIEVLYMSGYPDGALEPEKALGPGDHFLHKPFTPDAMVATVQRVLSKTTTAR
jgi:two-component system cell cycle sensor histidine kinase/response regulator CckA